MAALNDSTSSARDASTMFSPPARSARSDVVAATFAACAFFVPASAQAEPQPASDASASQSSDVTRTGAIEPVEVDPSGTSVPKARDASASATLPARIAESSPIDEVIVRGSVTDSLPKASGSGAVITARDLARAQPQNAGEMLRRVPSLNVRQEDTTGLRLNIGVRGLNPTRSRLVLVQEDGVPVVVSPYGEPELYFSTPIERIQSIDILKGSGVLLFGPQTVGGVINFHTWAPKDHADWFVSGDLGHRAYGKVVARYGNSVGDVRYVVQVMHKEGDGFRNMPFRANDMMGKVVFPTSSASEATVKLAAYDELSRTTYVGLTQELYADPRRASVAPDDNFGLRRYEASLAHDWRFATRTHVRAQLFAYTTHFRLRQQNFDRTPAAGVDYARVVGRGAANEGTLFFRPTAATKPRTYEVAGTEISVDQKFTTFGIAHDAIAGGRILADIARRQELSGPTSTLSGEMKRDDKSTIYGLAAYLQDTIALHNNLVVVPAVRVEHSISRRSLYRVIENVEGVDVSRDVNRVGTATATGVMPGLQAIVGTPKLNAFAGFHIGYSAPRLSASITPQGKDAGLAAERSRNIELGGRARPMPWIRGEAALFFLDFDNQLISNNTLSGDTSENKNGGPTRHIGGEGSLTAQLGRGLRLPLEFDIAGNYTYSQSRFVGGNFDKNFVPYSPIHTASGTLDVEHPSGIGAQASFTYVGRQYSEEVNLEEPDPSGRAGRIPAYTTLDLTARYHDAKTGITLTATVKNVTDSIYIAGRLPDGIFTSGFRQAFLGLSWAPASPVREAVTR
jgi:Fe(3+) dicitrate transport protein